ncbi:MAG: aminotransferase class V-fold PLP-dependent enzyme [Bacteroidales bacterium]|nr:aminotransferase class V-fold PLP-dependent enzyme [Bacteroidales bacterium]
MQVYLDNTATSWPKPHTVVDAISDYLSNYGGSPGRSGHAFALKAARIVFETRELLAEYFNADSSDRVIFTSNATNASNIAFKGILKKGDHVITSHMEHNSTIRPLRHLEQQGIIELTIIDCDQNGNIDLDILKSSFKPNTRLVSTIHGSNIIGIALPIEKIGALCKSKNILYHVDAAQTAGFLPIDVQKDNIDILTFTGHKKLLGPSGTGGIVIRKNIDIDTLIHGGSGSKSESETHPDFYPDKLEAGTPNTVGITGLKAGIEFIFKQGQQKIINHSQQITDYFLDSLSEIQELNLHGPGKGKNILPVISVTSDLFPPDKLASVLDKKYGIMTRSGLMCSPLGHKALGTFPKGTLRFSPGFFTTKKDIDYTSESLKRIITNKEYENS